MFAFCSNVRYDIFSYTHIYCCSRTIGFEPYCFASLGIVAALALYGTLLGLLLIYCFNKSSLVAKVSPYICAVFGGLISPSSSSYTFDAYLLSLSQVYLFCRRIFEVLAPMSDDDPSNRLNCWAKTLANIYNGTAKGISV